MSDDAMRSSVRAATTIRQSRSKSDRITDIADFLLEIQLDGTVRADEGLHRDFDTDFLLGNTGRRVWISCSDGSI